MQNNHIEIKRNFWKVIYYFMISIPLLFLGVYNISIHEYHLNISSIFIILASIFLIGLSITVLVSLFYEILNWKSAFVINNEGVIDNSGIESVGFIEWKDITGIEPVEIMSVACLLIETDKPEKYLKKAKNPFVSYFMRRRIKKYGTPIQITSLTLKSKTSELEDIIKTGYEKYKQIIDNS